jgi:hypothetical protein
VLAAQPNANVRVFAVWLPIVLTDFSRPSSAVMSRLPDQRVAQFWDRDHLLAKAVTEAARPPHPQPDCCEAKGILWDVAAVYREGARWDERLPPAVFLNGPVVDVTEAFGAALEKEAQQSWNDSFRTSDMPSVVFSASRPSR